MQASAPSNHVRFCFPPMGGYGAMHAKIQILKFPDYVRVVVPTGNLTRYDWGETGVLENVRKATAALRRAPSRPDGNSVLTGFPRWYS